MLNQNRMVIAVLFSLICFNIWAVNKVLIVEDFGAVADGKTDCTEAFEKAIARASEIGPGVTIQLGRGHYIISTELPEMTGKGQLDTSHLKGQDKEDAELYKQCRRFNVEPCIKMVNIQGITIAGLGLDSEIIVTCPLAIGFELTNCHDIIFQNLVIDYDPIPFTQGTITAVNVESGTFDYKVDNGFPALSEYWFTECDSKWGMSFDNQRRFRQGAESAVFIDSWDDLGGSNWRMHLYYKKQTPNMKIGDRFVHIARMGGTSTIFFSHCNNVSIKNLHIYANSGTATIFYRCEGDIHVDGLQVRPRPGSGRIFSLNGDCVHCQSCRKGPLIENCIFEGMSDDGMNFYGLPSVINDVPAPNQVKVSDPQVLRKGDRVQIIRPSEGIILDTDVEVIDVKMDLITLSKTIKGLKAGKNHVEADTLFNLSACGNGFVVRNNIIGGFRGRGILARAHHGLIENNLIHNTSGQGIVIANEPDWPEGPIPADVTIRNNTIVGVERDSMQADAGAIQISAFKLRYVVADKPGLQAVVIENNRIIDPPANAILLQGVRQATVKDNIVQLTANDRPLTGYVGVKLENCMDIAIDRFTMVDQWARIDSALVLDKTSKEQITIKNMNVDLRKGGNLIRE